jgi:uncharacterized protein (TIGR03000 family)
MYSVVLMMALSNGTATPTHDATALPATQSNAHYVYRHGGRGGHGCCGCNGGHHRHHHGHHGCCGCAGYNYCGCAGYNYCGCAGYSYGCGGDGHGHGAPATPSGKPTKTTATDDNGDAVATISVTLPEDAVLKIDDQPTTSTSGMRTLITPALAQGSEFHYTLTAEIVRDGQTLTTTKRVEVRAGEETQVSIEFPTAVVAQK